MVGLCDRAQACVVIQPPTTRFFGRFATTLPSTLCVSGIWIGFICRPGRGMARASLRSSHGLREDAQGTRGSTFLIRGCSWGKFGSPPVATSKPNAYQQRPEWLSQAQTLPYVPKWKLTVRTFATCMRQPLGMISPDLGRCASIDTSSNRTDVVRGRQRRSRHRTCHDERRTAGRAAANCERARPLSAGGIANLSQKRCRNSARQACCRGRRTAR